MMIINGGIFFATKHHTMDPYGESGSTAL